jgi:hypothetical protein
MESDKINCAWDEGMESSLPIHYCEGNPPKTIARQPSVARVTRFRLDSQPISARALLRAARMGLSCLFVVCIISSASPDFLQVRYLISYPTVNMITFSNPP